MDTVKLVYPVEGDDLIGAGEASSQMKLVLKRMGFPTDVIRRASICMYEGEINLVIHGGGGEIDLDIDGEKVQMVLTDHGPGIPDIQKAMEEGWSTAPDNVRSLGFGAGMGLPNMKKYSDEMKVESVVGEGTTVTMVVNLT